MGREKITVTLEIPSDIYIKALEIVNYINTHVLIENDEFTPAKIDHYISGAVKRENDIYDIYHQFKSFNKEESFESKELKNKFKQYFAKHGIKQIKVYEEIGIDKGTMSLIVNNRQQPSLEVFLKIWALLNYPPITELIEWVDE